MNIRYFITEVNRIGYNVKIVEDEILITGERMITPDVRICRHSSHLVFLVDDNRLRVLCEEFAMTPVCERGEKDKYYVILNGITPYAVSALRRFEDGLCVVTTSGFDLNKNKAYHHTIEEVMESHGSLLRFVVFKSEGEENDIISDRE